MGRLTSLLYLLSGVCFTAAVPVKEAETPILLHEQNPIRPIYAIAHQVLTVQGIQDALNDGANSLQIDVAALQSGWVADHDLTRYSAKTDLRDMFEAVVEQVKKGRDLPFIWLNIKTPKFCDSHIADNCAPIKHPDDCSSTDKCSIEALRGLSRELLEPEGVRVLYGFVQTENTEFFKTIQRQLGGNEAVTISGHKNNVMKIYNGGAGSSVPEGQRIVDYGSLELQNGFGNCEHAGICTELREESMARDKGKFKRVFAWSAVASQRDIIGKLLGTANVDGIIYGIRGRQYSSNSDSQVAAKDIVDFVKAHPEKLRMATQNDKPW